MSATDTTIPVRPGLELDAARLANYLAEHMDGFRGPLQVRQFKGGQSNPSYLLTAASGRYVLRRKPPGALLDSAHAVDREYRVLEALGRHSDVPVPAVRLLCTDDGVAGTWFFVMDYVEGRIFWDPAFPGVERSQRRDYVLALLETLARLHRVVPEQVGLTDFGKPTGYVARQIHRWSRQYREDDSAGRVESMDRLIDWLVENAPPDEPPARVVHGDYRSDNVIFDASKPRVMAILDWELSSLGNPLADLAYYLMIYHLPTLALPALAGHDLDALGLPGERECIDYYCRATGLAAVDDLSYYLAFCMFRLAAICHGIRGRVNRGNAVSVHAREYAKHVEAIAELGRQQAQAGGLGTSA